MGREKYNLIKNRDDDYFWYEIFFMTMDRNNNGSLTEEEIRKYMNFFELNWSNVKKDTTYAVDVLTNMQFKLANKRKDELITLSDYISGREKYNLIKNRDDDYFWYKITFMTMDSNGNGTLSEEEIRKSMEYFEFNL